MRKPQRAPPLEAMLQGPPEELAQMLMQTQNPDVQKFVRRANAKYLHWNKVRHYPSPDGVTHEAMWAAIAFSRAYQFRNIPISFIDGTILKYWSPPQHIEWLHRIDQDAGGNISGI